MRVRTGNPGRYPVVSNLRSTWTRDERTGTLVIPLSGREDALEIEYVRYRPPEYFLGLHALGTARFLGAPVRVRDAYRYRTVNNSGETRFRRTETSDEGLCGCGELVMAADAGQTLVLVETDPGVWTVDTRHSVDQSFHEIESDDYRCVLRFDPGRRALNLERSYFRDAST